MIYLFVFLIIASISISGFVIVSSKKKKALENNEEPGPIQKIQKNAEYDVYKTKLNNYGHRLDILKAIENVLLSPPEGYNYYIAVESTENAQKFNWPMPIHTGLEEERNLPGDAIVRISLRNDGNMDPSAEDSNAKTSNLSSFVHVRGTYVKPELIRFFTADAALEAKGRQKALLEPIAEWSEKRIESAISVIPTVRVL